jgi:hypothetical protein
MQQNQPQTFQQAPNNQIFNPFFQQQYMQMYQAHMQGQQPQASGEQATV